MIHSLYLQITQNINIQHLNNTIKRDTIGICISLLFNKYKKNFNEYKWIRNVLNSLQVNQ